MRLDDYSIQFDSLPEIPRWPPLNRLICKLDHLICKYVQKMNMAWTEMVKHKL